MLRLIIGLKMIEFPGEGEAHQQVVRYKSIVATYKRIAYIFDVTEISVPSVPHFHFEINSMIK